MIDGSQICDYVLNMAERTVHQRLADHLLGGKLDEFVVSRRAKGVSWRRIANELRDETGVDVAHETLRGWFPEPIGRAS